MKYFTRCANVLMQMHTGDTFVKGSVRQGLLPRILAALISARAATRAQLKDTEDPATRAVLDSRQKVLKLAANALYGFTGKQQHSQASLGSPCTAVL